jgi:Flp pilus assembly protein TadG
MKKSLLSKNNVLRVLRGQAIVEFAIVLPILLVILVGILEVGRMIFIYSAVTGASRDAVRYASAVGIDDYGFSKYNHCHGIREVAISSAFLMRPSDLTVTIKYDHGPGAEFSPPLYCDATSGEDVDVVNAGVTTGDRVLVEVTAQYRPMVKLVPITERPFTASSYRTILGIIKLTP